MKANELRIGNLFNWSGHVCTVIGTGINTSLIQWDKSEIERRQETVIMDYKEHLKKFKPIPLTEEWLIKLGIEKEGVYWQKSGITFYFKDGKLILIVLDIFEFEYVHQVQNFFALTGEELTIKE